MVSIKSPDASPTVQSNSENSKISNLDITSFPDKKTLSSDLFSAYISNALLEYQRGNSIPYDELVRQISLPQDNEHAPPEAKLRQWLDAFSNIVSQLNQSHRKLVHAIINISWVGRGEIFVKSYLRFLGYLISAQPPYLGNVVQSLVTFWSGKLADQVATQSDVNSQDILDRTHIALECCLSLVPTAPSNLFPIFVKAFPHKSQSLTEQTCYLTNLLRMNGYAPALRNRVLGVAIDRILQIDVEIQVELEELDDEDEDHGMFEFDKSKDENDSEEEEDLILNDSDLSDDDEGDSPVVFNIREMVPKLDHMLKILFDYISGEISLAKEKGESSTDLFFSMLDIFERIILCTFRSRYTQFLLFWMASLSPAHCDAFLGMLVMRVFDTSRPLVSRIASVFYTASFVARAKFLDPHAIRNVVTLLCNWIDDYVTRVEATGQASPDVTRHELFYSITQSVFYVFCFRWKDLEEQGEGGENNSYDPAGMIVGSMDSTTSGHIMDGSPRKWTPALMALRRATVSKLNPLKCCHPNVVKQFAKVSHSLDFIYCASIMEANRRMVQQQGERNLKLADPTTPKASTTSSLTTPISRKSLGDTERKTSTSFVRLRTYSTSSTPVRIGSPSNAGQVQQQSLSISNQALQQLEAFFPFDPYRLELSKSYIEEVYLEWQGIPGENNESDDEEEFEEGDIENSLVSVSSAMAIPISFGQGEFDQDDVDNQIELLGLDQMSISPVTITLDPRTVSARLMGM